MTAVTRTAAGLVLSLATGPRPPQTRAEPSLGARGPGRVTAAVRGAWRHWMVTVPPALHESLPVPVPRPSDRDCCGHCRPSAGHVTQAAASD